MISDPIAVLFVLAAVVYVSLRLEESFAVCRSLGAALVGMLLGMVLSNTGLLPGASPAYDYLMGQGVSIGVALILFGVDARSILQAGPRMLAAFGIGAAGTALGAVAGGLLLSRLVGEETWRLAGQFTGTYIGGGMNFAALGQALGTSSNMFTAAVAADVIVTAIWMAACLALPVLLGVGITTTGSPHAPGGPATASKVLPLDRALHESGRPVLLRDLAALVALAAGSVWLAGLLNRAVPPVPEILWLTTLALALAQVPAVKSLTGSALCGNYLLLLFLASNGASSVVANIVDAGPAVFYYAAATVAIHGIVIFGIGRLSGIDAGTLAVASQANVGGSASAMAMAGARGYTDRILPGVAVGLLGYAAGNYAGFAVAAIMRRLL